MRNIRKDSNSTGEFSASIQKPKSLVDGFNIRTNCINDKTIGRKKIRIEVFRERGGFILVTIMTNLD